MSKTSRSKKKSKKQSGKEQSIIKNPQKKGPHKEDLLHAEAPLFGFKYLSRHSIKDCKDPHFFYTFLIRLQQLSELGWTEIRKSHRHSFGIESIPIEKIKPQLPSCITPEIKELDVFRANGDNRPFIGIQVHNVFQILFIETCFGDIYDH